MHARAIRQSQLPGIAIWSKLQGPEGPGEGAISVNISCLCDTGKIADMWEFSRVLAFFCVFPIEMKLIPTFCILT